MTETADALPFAPDSLVRPAADGEQVQFMLTLPLQHQADLDALLQQLYSPGSPQFGQFLSSADFDQRFGPTPAQYQSLKALAGEFGFQVVGEHASRTVLDVQASAATVRTVLGSHLNVFRQRDGREYYAPDRDPQLPFVLSALGADAAGLYQKPLVPQLSVAGHAGAAATPVLQPQAGTQSGGTYAPADIRAAYNLVSLQRPGQTVALFELSSANYADAGVYARAFNLTNPSLVLKAVDGGTTVTSGSDEVMLDIEMVMAVANPASIIVYTGPNSSSGVIDTYTQIANDNLVNQVSTSWGACESSWGQSNVNAENTAFTKMAAEGIAVFAASGDSGAYACSGTLGASLGVQDPASQPYVTGVGGTSLSTSSTQAYLSEKVWDTSSSEAGGGGISSFWSIPSYQQGVVSNAASGQYSTSKRNVPDVALDSDPSTGYYVYDSDTCGGWCLIGGTSAAAPEWAAFWGLVGQGLAAAGKSPAHAGFANPLLYRLGENGTQAARDFHDITSGTNNYYSAVTGFDDATGWGSFNGANLYADLLSLAGAGGGGTGGGGGGGTPTPPAAPTNLTASGSFFSTTLTLSWKASAGATSYYVYEGTSAGGEGSTPVATVSGTTASISGLKAFTTYDFKVAAHNAAGTSALSNEASASSGL